MRVRLVLTLVGLAISFAVPASMAQDAMKVVTADEVVFKDDPAIPKGGQNAILIGDPSKAETIVLRAKFPPHYKIPPHTHTFSEVVTVLSGILWNGMGDDMEKGRDAKAGISFRASCKSRSSGLDNGRGGNHPGSVHWPRRYYLH